jgi:hypothetical protein
MHTTPTAFSLISALRRESRSWSGETLAKEGRLLGRGNPVQRAATRPGEASAPVRARVVVLNREDSNAAAMVEGKIFLSDKEAKVLIDLGSTYYFITSSFACALTFDDKSIFCNVVVSTPLGKQLGSNICYEDCKMRLRDVTLVGDLIRLSIEYYDVILGMDWLSRHYAQVVCRQKVVHFCRPGEDVLEFRGEKVKEESYLISGARDQKLLCKSCIDCLAYLLNKPSEPRKIEEVLVVNEYLDVFSTELTQVSPDREVEFSIDLVPTAEVVSRTPYRMAPAELKMLKE